jgi:hypothetical protein
VDDTALRVLVIAWQALMAGPAGTAGFRWQQAAAPDDQPLEVAL